MTTPMIAHHIPDSMIAAYAAGNLPQAYALVVATHISLCDDCRAAYHAHQSMGGVVLETSQAAAVSGGLKDSVMALLDRPDAGDTPVYRRSGIYPGPLVQALKGRDPKWSSLGMGIKQSILQADDEGSARLLFIPPGQAVPDHSHNGVELTLVLQGSFSDEGGRFGVGDVEVADGDVEHTPKADAGLPCICLAATDAPLRFTALMPRLLQPFFRI